MSSTQGLALGQVNPRGSITQSKIGYQSVDNNEPMSADLDNNEPMSADLEASLKELDELTKTKMIKGEDKAQQYFYHIIGGFVTYLLMSSVVYWYMEELHPMDAFYLSMITFTTIGYGDIAPTHALSKIFTCGFVFLNLLIVGQLLDFVVDTVVEQRKQASQDFLENVFDKEEVGNDDERHTAWISKEYYNLYEALVQAFFIIGGTIGCGVLFFCFIVDDHSIIDGIYLSCMSVSTVGYGDIVPGNMYAKAFGCVYAVCGTLLFGSAVSGFVGAVSEFRLLSKNEKELSNSVLDYETFMKADADGSDSVTKEEFVLFRLAQMGVIPDSLRERAEAQFDRMDADGSGDLTMEDIILHQNSHHSHEHQQLLLTKYRELKNQREHTAELKAFSTGDYTIYAEHDREIRTHHARRASMMS